MIEKILGIIGFIIFFWIAYKIDEKEKEKIWKAIARGHNHHRP